MNLIQLLAVSDGGVAAGIGLVGILFLLVGLALSVFWVWMLVDCLSSSLPTTEKVVWALVIFFTHIIGAALYYFMVRSGRGSGIV